jgi:hypothetical protein
VRRWIAELDSDDPVARELALAGLENAGESALAPLREAAEKSPSLEVRRRAGRAADQRAGADAAAGQRADPGARAGAEEAAGHGAVAGAVAARAEAEAGEEEQREVRPPHRG